MQESIYKHLVRKNIINILIGDKINKNIRIGETTIDVSMPYLSGPQICDLSGKLGYPMRYLTNSGPSRWQYFEKLLIHCIQYNKEEILLRELYNIENFKHILKDCSLNNIKEAYEKTIECIIEYINKELFFCGCMLCKNGENFYITPVDKPAIIVSPKIKEISHEYIHGLIQKTEKDFQAGNYDSVLTKSRTLLEEVFCFVLQNRGVERSTSGKITDLYGQVKQLYGMKQDKTLDKRINNLLSGLEKILTSISEMRNEQNDAHGVGSSRIRIAEHHARLFVNAAIVMADFILSVSEHQLSRK